MHVQIPIYQPLLRGREREYVISCLDSTWISSKGEFLISFERAFAEYVGVEYATSVCNGTAGLHLALLALGIGPGDEVIVPSFTYVASVNAIRYTGATPIFVNSERTTWQMDTEDVQRKISPSTRCILAVHLYGHACHMERLCDIARSKGLFIVEDCAEAFGTKFRGKYVGTFGDVSVFSFFGNKTITTGEGGMVVCKNRDLLDSVYKLKNQGLAKPGDYWHDVIGYNYRMTNIEAAIGLAQMERADEILAAKRELATWYHAELRKLNLECHEGNADVLHSFWMNSFLVRDQKDRDPLRLHLSLAGIETRPAFPLVHAMPMYNCDLDFPVARELSTKGINLPSWPGLTREQVEYICSAISAFYKTR